jgi:hypothetical protein
MTQLAGRWKRLAHLPPNHRLPPVGILLTTRCGMATTSFGIAAQPAGDAFSTDHLGIFPQRRKVKVVCAEGITREEHQHALSLRPLPTRVIRWIETVTVASLVSELSMLPLMLFSCRRFSPRPARVDR